MPLPEERQAIALVAIQHHLKDLVRVMTAMNDNFTTIGKLLKNAIETEETPAGVDPDQMTLDQLKAEVHESRLEMERRSRAERDEYEARTGEKWEDEGSAQHAVKFRAPDEGVE
jgi:hypothetical protein